ncbi:MAG: hypothetical protein GOU98_03430, partial [Candidatus Altiarchaeota archaeon]|nr:hypothetical protein [Candidatus Altiarchaeota archaeon]
MSNLVYQTVIEKPLESDLEPVSTFDIEEIKAIKTKYTNKIVDSFSSYLAGVDGDLNSRNLRDSLKL